MGHFCFYVVYVRLQVNLKSIITRKNLFLYTLSISTSIMILSRLLLIFPLLNIMKHLNSVCLCRNGFWHNRWSSTGFITAEYGCNYLQLCSCSFHFKLETHKDWNLIANPLVELYPCAGLPLCRCNLFTYDIWLTLHLKNAYS